MPTFRLSRILLFTVLTALVGWGVCYPASFDTVGELWVTNNAGIGTTYPTARLHIKAAGTGTGFALRIADSSVADKVVILDKGNLGIGTTNPTQELEVNGSIKWNSNILSAVTGPNGQILKTDGTGTIAWQTDSGSVTAAGSDGQVQYNFPAGTFAGTSLIVTDGSYLTMGQSSTQTASRLYVKSPATVNFLMRVADSNAADKLVITDNVGYIGIGVTNPGAENSLEIQGDGAGIIISSSSTNPSSVLPIQWYEGGATSMALNYDGSSATGNDKKIIVRNDDGSLDLVTFTRGGNVGIGSTDPSCELDVVGRIKMTQFQLDASVTSGQLLTCDADGVGTWQGLSGGGWSSSGSAVYLTTSSDNVGIGTSSPQGKLHVAGSTVILGEGEGGTPSAVTLRGPAASGSNIFGADMKVDASLGTGTGGSGDIIFRTAGQSSVAAITHDATTVATRTDDTSHTFSHTVGTGPNRILIVGCSMHSDSVASITYAGDNLTEIDFADSGTNRAELWYLVNPDSGANNVVINWDGSPDSITAACSYYNVDQSSPLGTPSSNDGSSSTASVVVSSASGELVVDCVAVDDVNPSLGANQTQRWSDTSGNVYGEGSSEPGASSVTMSWSISGGDDWSLVAVPLKPVSSGSLGLTERLRVTKSGNIGIGTSAPSATLEINGNLKAKMQTNLSGSTAVWAGTGPGTVYELGYDVAELFEASEEVESADVLVIGKDGRLSRCQTEYDTKLIGVVSAAPAILFEGPQLQLAPDPFKFTKGTKPPIALAGRAYVKASARNGPITPGDFLTTSAKPGYAMKASTFVPGAMIGKSLDFLEEGEDTILVLLYYQ